MAEKLSASDDKVVHLNSRKAKGAKSSGGAARKPRLIPAKHETKPRGRPAKAAEPRAASAQPTDADVRAHQQDRLIALHTKHRAVDNRLEVVMATVADIKLEKKEVRAAIQNAGFPLALYDEAYSELKLKTSRIDLEEKERIRGLIREALGLPAGPQASLLDGLPDAARAEVFWEDVGFREGVNGEPANAEKAGVPPENVQHYLQGHGKASEHNARGLKGLDAPEPKRDAEPLVSAEDAPFWNDFPVDKAMWTLDQRMKFRKWFEGLGPDDDVEIEHAGALQMFDELEGAESPEDEVSEFS